MFKKKLFIIIFAFLALMISSSGIILADDATPTPSGSPTPTTDNSQSVQDLQYKIDQTNQQIDQTQKDIQIANTRISSLQGSLDNLTKVLLNRIVENYKVSQTQPIQVMLTAQDATDFVRKENYLRIAQEHDQQIAYDTVQAKNDYANQKNIFEEQKKKMEALQSQLQDYSKQLDSEKASKQTLLEQTQGSEANYQHLLAQAQAQLASFSRFV